MAEFVPGLALCGQFYAEAVLPILDSAFPGLRYSAARIGSGSDVLGFDTEMSMDHDWGPSLQIFVEEADFSQIGDAVREILSRRLPPTFQGYSTGYALNEDGTLRLSGASDVVNHRVEIITAARFFEAFLGFDIRNEIEPADWLSFPEQKLLAITSGAVYCDGIGMQAIRERFAYYPRDVWLYLLAAGWNRIGQEEHLMGRAGIVGDELGSSLIGSRLARDVMRLCFLMERQYAPYSKWFGTVFKRLKCASRLEPLLMEAMRATAWQDRENALVQSYEIVAGMHNALGLTEPLPATAVPFYNRPFRVITLEAGFAGAIARRIEDPRVRQIAAGRLLGSIDQVSDNTDLLCGTVWRNVIKQLYN